jgi:hypothetical protein
MTATLTKEVSLIDTFGSRVESIIQDIVRLVIDLLDRAFAPYVGTAPAVTAKVLPEPLEARTKQTAQRTKKTGNTGGSQRVLDHLKKGPATMRQLMPVYKGGRSRVSAALTRLKHLGLVEQGPEPRSWRLKAAKR